MEHRSQTSVFCSSESGTLELLGCVIQRVARTLSTKITGISHPSFSETNLGVTRKCYPMTSYADYPSSLWYRNIVATSEHHKLRAKKQWWEAVCYIHSLSRERLKRSTKRVLDLGTLHQLRIDFQFMYTSGTAADEEPIPLQIFQSLLDRNGVCVTDAQFLSRLNIPHRVELNSAPNSTLLEVRCTVCISNMVRGYEGHSGQVKLTMIEVRPEHISSPAEHFAAFVI